MPRDKNTETVTVDMENLPDLSPAKQVFVRALLDGKTASDAYREASGTDAARESVWVLASRWRHDEAVKAWLRAARLAGLFKIADDYAEAKRQHIEEMQALADEAKEAGNYGAAVQAKKAVGQVLGLYIEKYEDAGKRPATADLLTRIETELGPAARKAAAVRLGLEETSHQRGNDDDQVPATQLTH